MDQHFQQVLSFWAGLPPYLWKENPVEPNIDSFVFCKSKEQVNGLVIEDEEEEFVDLRKGSQMLVSYRTVRNLLASGKVHLI